MHFCEAARPPQTEITKGETKQVSSLPLGFVDFFFFFLALLSFSGVTTYRGDFEDASSVAELHEGRVDRAESRRVQTLPDQGPLEALQRSTRSPGKVALD